MDFGEFLKERRAFLAACYTNRKGQRIKGRYLIIESDDWGAIRTPSVEALKAFENMGMNLTNSVYKYDALESDLDMEYLLNVINDYKDGNGNHPRITANVVLANPDFEKIKTGNFEKYYFELFTKTLLKYSHHDHVFQKWQEGIRNGLFIPQFHGREHLNFNRWLKLLRSGNEKAIFCFNSGTTYSGYGDYSFMGAFDWDKKEEVAQHKVIIKEGLQLFKSILGYDSCSFVAPCYYWDPELEPVLANNGVKIIQGTRKQLAPTGILGNYRPIPHFFMETNKYGLTYNIRNCFFEPSSLSGGNWVDICLAQITSAFWRKKPAVICSHRVNYIGVVDEKNRNRGLNALRVLLKLVLKKWPDVQFISTDQLENII